MLVSYFDFYYERSHHIELTDIFDANEFGFFHWHQLLAPSVGRSLWPPRRLL